ncbi:helix-turn-helix domain-containing protein [Anaerotignum sp.]
MSDFAKNLRQFRKEKGYTQIELAKLINYGYTAIANYESTRNEPSLDI